MSEDPYAILGVKREATQDEIRSAYRQLAKKLHPDLNPGDKQAEEKFKQVAAAYDLLGDPEKRGRFDRGEIDASGAERPPRERYYRDFHAPRRGASLWQRRRVRGFCEDETAGSGARARPRPLGAPAHPRAGRALPAAGGVHGGGERCDQAHHAARRHHA